MTRWLRLAALLLGSLMLMARPALAQSILRDAETEAFMADMSGDLVKAAGMQPRNVQVMVINDPEINA
ncbi:peptidase M48, partial [Pseudomonas frederiksbergensis]|nr:peptidase M48 [Pseudomonas frederiksbergensis]